MSLEELNGPILHLVLSIKEGHGFGFLQTPMVVVASTSGLCLETENIQPCPDPIIRTDLAWETDKKSLRGFRTSNTPVKVECFSIRSDVKRDRIGYILLNIKSAQVIPNGKPLKLLEKCHRLINVPQEAKLLKPELLLSLNITEANAPVNTSASSCSGLSKALPGSPQSSRNPPCHVPTTYDVPLVPIFRPDEGLVQIGPEDTCTDTLIFSLNIDKVGNLSLLTPKKVDLPADDVKSIHVSCVIFCTTLTTKTINGESVLLGGGGDTTLTNERMQLQLFSSIPTLFRYFRENPSCTVQLHVSGREIAAAELRLSLDRLVRCVQITSSTNENSDVFQSLLRTDKTAAFVKDFGSSCSKSQRCVWISSFTAASPAAPSGVKPFVDITTLLEFAGDQTVDPKEVKSQQPNPAHFHTHAPVDASQWLESNPLFTTETVLCGHESINNEGQEPVIKKIATDIRLSQPQPDVSIISNDQDEFFRPQIPSELHSSRSGNRNSAFKSVNAGTSDESTAHKYILRVSLTSATFDRVPTSQRLRFRFDYPNGHVLTTSITDVVSITRCVPVDLVDIGATIVLYSSPGAMVSELRTGVVVMTVAEVNADPSITGTFARASLPISCVCLPGKVESSVSVVLGEESSHMQIGIIHALLSLEDCGRLDVSSVRSQPHMPDNLLKNVPSRISSVTHFAKSSEMNRAVDEIEEWKKRQKEIFSAELKEKEAIFLERADEMCLEKKRQVEKNFENNMAQCRSLAEALSVAREELARRSQICLEKEEEFKHFKEDLEKKYNVKFQELTLAAKRLDEGVKIKVMLSETRCKELEDLLKALTAENEKLRRELEEEKNTRRKRTEMSALLGEESSGLNQQQVAKLLLQVKLLEEKLQLSMKSKAFLKEQWGRATREANLSKHAKCSSVRNSLENVEETVSSLEGKGLEQILLREEEELRRDSEALELLRRQIGDVCRTKIDL